MSEYEIFIFIFLIYKKKTFFLTFFFHSFKKKKQRDFLKKKKKEKMVLEEYSSFKYFTSHYNEKEIYNLINFVLRPPISTSDNGTISYFDKYRDVSNVKNLEK